jgi:hypothetical protein
LVGEDSHGIKLAEECGVMFRVCQLEHRVRDGHGFFATGREDTCRSVGIGAIDQNCAPDRHSSAVTEPTLYYSLHI